MSDFVIDCWREKKKITDYTGNDPVVVVPEGITAIGYRCFERKKGIKKVILPSSLTEIEVGAFFMCEDLEEIEVPGSVKELLGQTFQYCYKLKKVVLNEGLESISYGVFAADPELKELNIPSTVIKLGEIFRDTFIEGYQSPFEWPYSSDIRCGISKNEIKIACPERFNDMCFNGTAGMPLSECKDLWKVITSDNTDD